MYIHISERAFRNVVMVVVSKEKLHENLEVNVVEDKEMRVNQEVKN